jgi:pyrroloquinoline quinone biosynthesis protein B
VLASCVSSGGGGAPPASEPYVLLLGTAQDGGLPQIGCPRECCRAAREDPARRRLVVSALVVDPRSGERWLLDASPDLPEQVERAAGHGAPRGEGRPALFDGIFLTHAHIGHYTGLAALGREAYGTAPQTVHCSGSMAEYLSTNGPWELMVRLGQLRLEVMRPDEPMVLGEGLTIEALEVPHRPEYSDTYAFVVRGPSRSLLFLPDIDKWERWERRIEDVIADVDVALLDATFYDEGEVPGRSMADIPHPFIAESIERFAALPQAERAKVRLFHLNHTNPAADPTSEAARTVRAAGMSVAADGERFGL